MLSYITYIVCFCTCMVTTGIAVLTLGTRTLANIIITVSSMVAKTASFF